MKRPALWSCLLATAFVCTMGLSARADTVFAFVLGPEQVTPPATNAATGRAVAILSTDETTITFVIEHNLENPLDATIYRGERGTWGVPLLTLPTAISQILEFWNDPTPDDVADLKAGLLFVQLGSLEEPAGALRGQVALNPDPQPGDVILSEIMYNPASAESPAPAVTEWIELFNPSFTDVNIGGWYFQDEDPVAGDPCTPARSGSIPDFVLRSGQVVVIIPDGRPGVMPSVADFKTAWNRPTIDVLQLIADGTANGALAGSGLANDPVNDGNLANNQPLDDPAYRPCTPDGLFRPDNEILVLRNATRVIDEVNYDDNAPWPADTGFSSITLVTGDYPFIQDFDTYSGTGNDVGSHWRSHALGDAAGGFLQGAAAGVYGGSDIGSPGYLSGATYGNQPPVAQSMGVAVVSSGTEEFDLRGADATRPFLGLLLYYVKSLPAHGQLIDIATGHVLTPDDVAGPGYLLSRIPFNGLRYVNDGTCGRDDITFSAFDGWVESNFAGVELLVQCGDGPIITEVMYDSDSIESEPPLTEWVELYNPTDAPMNLAGWSLATANSRSGQLPPYILGAHSAVVMIPRVLPAEEFAAAWCAEGSACPLIQPTTVDEIGNGGVAGAGLGNLGEALRVLGPNVPGNVVDAVVYEDGSGTSLWPVSNGGASIHVEEGAYDRFLNDDPSEWAASDTGVAGAYDVTPTAIFNNLPWGPPYESFDRGSPGIIPGVVQSDCGATAQIADGNGDTLVDYHDFLHYDLCFGGIGVTPAANCTCFDADLDGDVDFQDFAALQARYTGP